MEGCGLGECPDRRLFVSEVTASFSHVTSARSCSMSVVAWGVLTAATEGAATSITLSASAASSSKLTESAVEARTIRMLPGMRWRKKPAEEGAVSRGSFITQQLLHTA